MFSDCSSSTDSSSYSEGSTIPGFISVPMSDSSDKGSQASWPGLDSHHKSKMYQAYKGQVKLSVYINYGLLTVHVMMGRHLVSQRGTACNSYVKLCLIPDDSQRTKCKTEIIHDTATPHFDEKFSFELLEEDVSKRLYISVWNRHSLGNQCEFLGCMSFGIQHIQSQKKTVGGWYYLLTAELGIRKHLQVSDKRPYHSDRGPRNIPTVNRDVQWMEPHTLTVKRGRTGFGFSISGACPVYVCRVDPGSKSDIAGLQKNDCIVRIDGMNVSRSASDSVARIIKHAQKRITIEVQRPKKMESVQIEHLQSSPRKPLCSSTPYDEDTRDIGDMNVSPWRPGRMLPMMPLEDLMEQDEEDMEEVVEPKQMRLDSGSKQTRLDSGSNLANQSGVQMHDYGWLDLGGKVDAPKQATNQNPGLSMATNTYSSATLPRSFKLKRSTVKGLINRKEKKSFVPQDQKENHGVFSHGFTENRFTQDQNMRDITHEDHYGVFPHGQVDPIFQKHSIFFPRKHSQSSHNVGTGLPPQSKNVFSHGYSHQDYRVFCDTAVDSVGSSHSGTSLPRKKRVSFKDFS